MLPPDVLRNRLSQEQQQSIGIFLAQVEKHPIAVQAAFVATMLASEPAKWRTQLTKLAPLLGIELIRKPRRRSRALRALAPPARLPLLIDLLSLLDGMDPADRKRLRAVARAFAPTVARGDMLRFAVTRMLEKRLAKAVDETAAGAAARARAGRLRVVRGAGAVPVSAWASRDRTPIAPASWACCHRRSGGRTRRHR